jgi:hypothetical protein
LWSRGPRVQVPLLTLRRRRSVSAESADRSPSAFCAPALRLARAGASPPAPPCLWLALVVRRAGRVGEGGASVDWRRLCLRFARRGLWCLCFARQRGGVPALRSAAVGAFASLGGLERLRFARQGFGVVGPWAGRIGRVKSGSVWLVYGVAVVVTFVIGVLAFSVFVLSKVFGGSAPEQEPAPVSSVRAEAVAPSVTAPVVAVSVAKVLEVRAVVADSRQVVLIVASPGDCARGLRAAVFAEGPGAVAVRVTQEALPGCKWERRAVLAVARAPLGDRTLIVNGTPWTAGADGYGLALRASS